MSQQTARINLALAGSGIFAQTSYLPALLAEQGNINLHSLWSRSKRSTDALTETAKELGLLKSADEIKVYNGTDSNGLDALLADPEIDAVAFILPITAQPELVVKALKAGKHVISEKPLGKDVKDAKALIETYERDYKPKGLIWRVAENYNHETAVRRARDLARDEALGPILYWQLNVHAFCADGSKYQSTEWRTVPDYQGGFLLDGGVHFAAALRTVLPVPPTRIIANSALHRTHLLPHDTIIGFGLPPSSATIEPSGPATQVKALRTASDYKGVIGRSSPHGTFSISWAAPDLDPADKLPTELVITALNGLLVLQGSPTGWKLEVRPAVGSTVQRVKEEYTRDGVQVELREFAQAVAEVKQGVQPSAVNWGEPRLALWDLGFIESALTSDGKEIDMNQWNA